LFHRETSRTRDARSISREVTEMPFPVDCRGSFEWPRLAEADAAREHGAFLQTMAERLTARRVRRIVVSGNRIAFKGPLFIIRPLPPPWILDIMSVGHAEIIQSDGERRVRYYLCFMRPLVFSFVTCAILFFLMYPVLPFAAWIAVTAIGFFGGFGINFLLTVIRFRGLVRGAIAIASYIGQVKSQVLEPYPSPQRSSWPKMSDSPPS
jgi:hypothetical protein